MLFAPFHVAIEGLGTEMTVAGRTSFVAGGAQSGRTASCHVGHLIWDAWETEQVQENHDGII